MTAIEGCMENSSDVAQDSKINYTCWQKRSFFPCSADEKFVRNFKVQNGQKFVCCEGYFIEVFQFRV